MHQGKTIDKVGESIESPSRKESIQVPNRFDNWEFSFSWFNIVCAETYRTSPILFLQASWTLAWLFRFLRLIRTSKTNVCVLAYSNLLLSKWKRTSGNIILEQLLVIASTLCDYIERTQSRNWGHQSHHHGRKNFVLFGCGLPHKNTNVFYGHPQLFLYSVYLKVFPSCNCFTFWFYRTLILKLEFSLSVYTWCFSASVK